MNEIENYLHKISYIWKRHRSYLKQVWLYLLYWINCKKCLKFLFQVSSFQAWGKCEKHKGQYLKINKYGLLRKDLRYIYDIEIIVKMFKIFFSRFHEHIYYIYYSNSRKNNIRKSLLKVTYKIKSATIPIYHTISASI